MKYTFNDIRYMVNECARLLTENQESKNLAKTRNYLLSLGYNKEQAWKTTEAVRNDIPNSRLMQCKYLLGTTRIYLNNPNGDTTRKLNTCLKYIATDAHCNEYNSDLNGMDVDELYGRFKGVASQDLEKAKELSNSKQYTRNIEYNIVRIPDFETASEYGKYTDWCVTHYPNMYNSYTNEGSGLFYFCLKNGFKNIPAEKGEGCPLDEYGLSMIAVSVTEEGNCNTVTCRWNHDNGGNDNIMSVDQVEELLGVNFYKTFIPYTKDELRAKGIIPFEEIPEILAQGISPDIIFDARYAYNNMDLFLVRYRGKYNFVNKENKLTSEKWFDEVGDFNNCLAKVRNGNKYGYINANAELIGQGCIFDDAYNFHEGFAIVEIGNKYGFINTNCELIGQGCIFDMASNFYNGFSSVKIGDKWGYINTNGEFIGQGCIFDWVNEFFNGFGKVLIGNKQGYINTNGELIGQGCVYNNIARFYRGLIIVQFENKFGIINSKGQETGQGCIYDDIDYFYNDFAKVKIGDKYGYINDNGELIGEGCIFDWGGNFNNGFAEVKIGDKFGFINTNGELLGKGCIFDEIYNFRNDIAIVQTGDKFGFINREGQELGQGCIFDAVSNFRNGLAKVKIGNKDGYINTNGELEI